MKKIKEELIKETIGRDVISFDGLDNYWVIIVDNKLFAPDHCTSFFVSRDKAWKCWYQHNAWGIKSRYRRDVAHQAGYTNSWSYPHKYPMTDREVWEAFKAQTFEDFDFKIIQWKDAKRDVCGKSRVEGDC